MSRPSRIRRKPIPTESQEIFINDVLVSEPGAHQDQTRGHHDPESVLVPVPNHDQERIPEPVDAVRADPELGGIGALGPERQLFVDGEGFIRAFQPQAEDLIAPPPAPPAPRKDDVKGHKPKSEAWASFDQYVDPTGKIICSCKLCGRKVSAQAQRLTKHLNDYHKKATASAPTSLCAQMPEEEEECVVLEDLRTSKTTEKKLTQAKLMPVKVDKSFQDKADRDLARFWFSTNTPFNKISSKYFRQFVKTLNPAYHPPCRETLRTTLLDSIYQEVIEERKEELKNTTGVIMQDGWSTRQNRPTIAHCLSTVNSTHFVSVEETGTSFKDAKYCFSLFEKAMKTCQDEYQCRIVGFITDNCSTMVALQREVKLNYPHLEVYGCNAHLMNLIGLKFTKADYQDKVNKVHRYMRNHNFTSARLKELGAKRSEIATTVRWNSQIDAFLSYIENQVYYLTVIREVKDPKTPEDKEKLRTVRQIVSDNNFFEALKEEIKIIRPICEGIDTVQRDNSNIADAARIWIGLDDKLPFRIVTSDYYKKQRSRGMTDVACAAYLLHPAWKGDGLTEEDKRKAFKWIKDKNQDFLLPATSLDDLHSEFFFPEFQDDAIAKSAHPIQWWKKASRQSLPRGMLDMVSDVFSMPGSTGLIERGFSTLGQILSTERSSLDTDRASKLCSVSNHLKLNEKVAQTATRKRKFELVE